MTVLMDHPFMPNQTGNPRLARTCNQCQRIPEVHPPTPGGRDPVFEREFIGLARRRAGVHESWEHDVHDRLQRMEREKGTESYLAMTLRQIVGEDDEEGLDLGGWSMVGALVAFRDLPNEERRQAVQDAFCQIASKGAEVRHLCDQLRDLLT